MMKGGVLKRLMLWTFLVIQVATVKWAKRKEDCIILSDNLGEIHGVDNVLACLALCELTKRCESISWLQNSARCLLFQVNVVEDSRHPKWVVLDHWITYSKVIYPVVRRLNPNTVDYGMPFEDAVRTCIDQHSTIAAPGDLLVNRELGMDNCWCCWLSNGMNGFVAQTVDSCPEKVFSEDVTDVIYCNWTSAPAWCKLN